MIVFVDKKSKNEAVNLIIGHLPPSVKFVYKTLEEGGMMTQKDLISRTTLPPRTVRYALMRLKSENLLRKRQNLADARQSLYDLGMPENGKASL